MKTLPPTTHFISAPVVWGILLLVTGLRVAVLIISPLQLGVDEAQYWLWSQTPAVGYFSKPPMIAWLIASSTAIFGDSEAAIRLPAPLFQAGTALLLWRLGGRLYSPLAGRLAALIWLLLPGVAVGSFVVSTDTPMLFFLTAFLLVLAPLALQQPISHTAYALAGGLLGLAILAKYAGIYGLIGLAAWWAASPDLRRVFRLFHWLILLAVCLVVISPNILWNISHDFITARHLGDNANWHGVSISILGGLAFLASQAGVVGPLAFAGLIMAWVASNHHKNNSRFLTAFIAPPLLLITIQAMLAGANANWAVAAIPPAVVLLAGWLVGRGIWLATIVISNTGLAAIVLVSAAIGSLGIITPPSDPLRHLRGWEIHAGDITEFAGQHQAQVVVTDRRRTAALLTYMLRASPWPVTINDSDGVPSNYYEAVHAWRPTALGRRVVLVTEEATPPPLAGVVWSDVVGESHAIISYGKIRRLRFFLGND